MVNLALPNFIKALLSATGETRNLKRSIYLLKQFSINRQILYAPPAFPEVKFENLRYP